MRRLPGPIFSYIDGPADDEITHRENTASCDRCDLVPNVLRGVHRSPSWAREGLHVLWRRRVILQSYAFDGEDAAVDRLGLIPAVMCQLGAWGLTNARLFEQAAA